MYEKSTFLIPSIDRKHAVFYVKFEVELPSRFARKLKFKKSGTFSWRMICPFSITEFENPTGTFSSLWFSEQEDGRDTKWLCK
jgi:hypothetical protein